jgi:hypothetical protein
MKDIFPDDESPLSKFNDQIVILLDGASDELTLAEMVGALELQLHILKNRMTGYKQSP